MYTCLECPSWGRSMCSTVWGSSINGSASIHQSFQMYISLEQFCCSLYIIWWSFLICYHPYSYLFDKHFLLRWWLSISSCDPLLPYNSVLFHNLLLDGSCAQYSTINTVSSVLCILKLELCSAANLVSPYPLYFVLPFAQGVVLSPQLFTYKSSCLE